MVKTTHNKHLHTLELIFRTFVFFSDYIPAYVLARGIKALEAYQRALKSGRTYDKRVKVVLVGQDRVGKTSLGKCLRGEPFNKDEPSTEGVQMIPAIKNAGKEAWKNPASLENMAVFWSQDCCKDSWRVLKHSKTIWIKNQRYQSKRFYW